MGLLDRISEKFAKKMMSADMMRQAVKSPELLKPYYDKSDRELKKIFRDQAKEHKKNPFMSPYWWAYLYWVGVDVDEKLKKLPRALAEKARKALIEKGEKGNVYKR